MSSQAAAATSGGNAASKADNLSDEMVALKREVDRLIKFVNASVKGPMKWGALRPTKQCIGCSRCAFPPPHTHTPSHTHHTLTHTHHPTPATHSLRKSVSCSHEDISELIVMAIRTFGLVAATVVVRGFWQMRQHKHTYSVRVL